MRNPRSKQKILLVDADEERRQKMAETLQGAYQVTIALDGEMALDILKDRQDFAAILLQCKLYKFSGFDVLGYLHTNRVLATIPTIAMGEAEDELKALSLGAVSFIQMPKDAYMINYQVRNLVELIKSDRDCDALTGVLQWESFLKETREILEQEEQDQSWGMIFLNVDRFKVFNDLFGRSMGDQLLQSLTARVRGIWGVRSVGRVGGDRFVLLCRMDELDLNRLRNLALELMRRMHLQYTLRIRYGVYGIDDPTLPTGELCDRAQIAQETISSRNEDDVAFYDEALRQQLRWEQNVTSQMYEALEKEQFEVYLQPIFSLSADMPISAEALVRWIHPTLGLIPPDRFIPLFERNGFISKLDQYVWERVFQYLAEFKLLGYTELSISSNMSRVDIYSADVCGQLIAMAKKYDITPSSFRIEVTESAYMDDPRRLLDATRRFNAAGFAVMIDDFGSGYSSLNMLMDMPVSTLKLDMSFVRGVGSDERTNCVVTSILRMAKWLEMSVVAEGVENQNQIDYLRAIGCDRVQGYYFSKPTTKGLFLALLKEYQGKPIREDKPVFDKTADTEAVWAAVSGYDRMLDGKMDAAALYELSGDLLEILCVNDSYYRLMESSAATMFRDTQTAMSWIGTEDRKRMLRALRAAAETQERQEFVVQRFMSSSRVKNLMVSACYMGRKDNRMLFLMLLRDISILDQREKNVPTEDLPPQPQSMGGRSCHKILIVEDNQVNRMVLKKILAEDYEILEAADGMEGLELLRRQPDIDAVLLDIIMPIMDGYEFLSGKASSPALAEIPVLVLSQSENRDSENRARELGADGFVRKPYDPTLLRQTLETLVKDTK